MSYPLDRCPQTDEEMRDYFFTLIGRALGASAHDYEAVLTKAYPWKGSTLRIPDGVGPGIKQPADAPFFGLTQQFSGVPKCRVFLPSNTADENGYYTRCDQYVDNAPNGSGLVWAWYYVAGHGYDPIMTADGGGSSGADTSALEARIAALEATAIKDGDRVGLLSTANAKYVRVEQSTGAVAATADNDGPWEEYTVKAHR